MSPPPTQPAPPPGRSTNPFDDDDDSDYDDETISRMLDNMDIDADFNCWTSFRASMSIKSPKNSIASAAPSSTFDVIGEREEAEEPLTQSERAYIDKWSRRVDREEVYSRTYRPVPREERELKDLAAFLGVTSGGSAAKQSGGAGGLFDKMNMGNAVSVRLPTLYFVYGLRHPAFLIIVSISLLKMYAYTLQKLERAGRGTAERSAVLKLLFPLPDEEKSVLLKRGPVLMQRRGQVDYEERELILLSRGLIIATPLSANEVADAVGADKSSPPNQQKVKSGVEKMPSGLTKIPSGLVHGLARIPSGLGKKVIHRHFESATMLTSLGVEDLTTRETNSFALFVDKDSPSPSAAIRFVFTCAKRPEKEAWVTALEKAMDHTKISSDNAGCDRATCRATVDNAFGGMAANTMSRNMAALQERGDRLEKLDHRTVDLERNAAGYRETARQLKEKAKKQTVFGL